jgi:hypothetical protein
LRARRRHRALRSRTVRLGILGDGPAILRALNRVLKSLANGSLSPDRAQILLQCISLASRNLPRCG